MQCLHNNKCTDQNASSALHYASAGNQLEVIQLLLQAGALVNARDKVSISHLG